MSAVGEFVCFHVARQLADRQALRTADYGQRMFDPAAYDAWRRSELQRQFTSSFDAALVGGRDVLDFGCGSGGLAVFLAEQGARTVVGVDIDPVLIGRAREAAERLPSRAVRFLASNDPMSIHCPDASIDVITCFDVLEHVMDVDATLAEWHRVLRPNGSVLIWWGGGWYSPFAPHIESLVPIPWAHVVFSVRTLLRVAARVYDLPYFRPRTWDIDPATGTKRANKWRQLTRLPDVNDLTIGSFNRRLRRQGFTIVTARYRGFTSRYARWTAPLARVPIFREFVAGSITYRLRKRSVA